MQNPSDPTPEQALSLIQQCFAGNRVRVTNHARQRMTERRITAEDVRHAIRSATRAVYRPEDQSWRIQGGTDVDGEDTEPRIAIEASGVAIVTVT